MNYDRYRLSPGMIIKYGLIYCLIIAVAAYVFYDSLYAFLILLPAVFLFFRLVKKELVIKQKDMLKRERSN